MKFSPLRLPLGSLFGLFSVQFGLLDVGYYQKSPEPKEDETHVEVAISSARLRFIWKPRRWAKVICWSMSY